jgi:phenylpyruvate tautomerase PptA (4-oxalocrotonate tautomerase family)
MPVVRIDVIGGKSPAYKKAVLDGVHDALVEAFKIPQDDRNQMITEHRREDFETRSTRSENFTLIEITAFTGRSLAAKRKLYALIGANMARSPGIKSDDILIVINEPHWDNWGIKGCKPASEVEIGFKVDV